MARAMIERGHQVLAVAGGEGPVADQLRSAGVPYRPLRFLRRALRPVADLRAFQELAGAVREFAPDLVSVHTAKAGWIGRAVAARLRIPVVYTPHGWSVGSRISPLAGTIFGWAERRAARWAKAIVCVSEHERQLALSKRIASAGQLRVVLNGVHDIPAALRANPGASPPRIVSVARLEAPKDQALLLRALAEIRSAAWELDLAGDGPLEGKLRGLASRLGIAGRVRFLGYVSDPAEVLARAQVFVLASRSEGFPRSILEAMRAGLPVVASAVGGVPEAVADGVNGLLVPPSDSRAMAASLSKLLAASTARIQMGAEGRRVYENRFRFERMAEETIAVYAGVCTTPDPSERSSSPKVS
jgi:glycosyltransferase involved in cell wall biosynthesis